MSRPGRSRLARTDHQYVHEMHGFQRTALVVQGLHEVPQLDCRKFTEALLDVPLRRLEKDPPRRAAALRGNEMDATAPRAQLGVGLGLDEDVPPVVAAPQLAHVLGTIRSRESGAHWSRNTLPASFLRVRLRPPCAVRLVVQSSPGPRGSVT